MNKVQFKRDIDIFNNIGDDDQLKIKILTAMSRFKRGVDLTDDKIILAFSGGKDSTILLKLCELAIEMGYIFKMPKIVFSDTRVEYDAIYSFIDKIKDKYDIDIVIPEHTLMSSIKSGGFPILSKVKSEYLSTWQKNLEDENKASNKPELGMYRAKCLVYSNFEHINKKGELISVLSKNKIANKHIHLLHNDVEYKIGNKCCKDLKKTPLEKYYKDNDINGYFSGVRLDEGGARAMAYSSCTSVKKVGGKEMFTIMPIYDWTEDDEERFIELFNVELSEAYTVYGLERTGCAGCPYARDLYKNLKALYEYEPKKYRFWVNIFKNVYIDTGVKLDFDQEYMSDYNDRIKIIEKRNKEMMLKYRH